MTCPGLTFQHVWVISVFPLQLDSGFFYVACLYGPLKMFNEILSAYFLCRWVKAQLPKLLQHVCYIFKHVNLNSLGVSVALWGTHWELVRLGSVSVGALGRIFEPCVCVCVCVRGGEREHMKNTLWQRSAASAVAFLGSVEVGDKGRVGDGQK